MLAVSEAAPLALNALTPEALVAAVPELSLTEARKVVSAVHRGQPLVGLPQVRKGSLEAVRLRGSVPTLVQRSALASGVDPFTKLVLQTRDGHVVETVRIPLERPGRFTACVSSQVGCALACSFCATGRLGLARNLEAWEIVEQVRWIRDGLPVEGKKRVHGVVFQGMGEPLANLDRVLEAIAVLQDPCALAIDGRNITVSTAGLPSGIRRLAKEAPKVRLAVSIHAAGRPTRAALMPIDRTHPLEAVLEASVEHARATHIAPLWAVTLLAGVNDADDDARHLAQLAEGFAAAAGLRPRLSIITYNPIGPDAAQDPYSAPSPERVEAFRAVLHASGIPSHRRYSGGPDIGAACGQLAGHAVEESEDRSRFRKGRRGIT